MPWQTLSSSVGLIDLLMRDLFIVSQFSGSHHKESLLHRDRVGQLLDRCHMASLVEDIGGNNLLSRPPDVSDRPTFLHIMKTAGTSFHAAIEHAFGVPALWMNLDVLRLMPPEVVSAAPLIVGHIPWEGQKLIGRDRKFLSILRDPRARTLSHFHQIESAPEVIAEVGELTLDEFLFDPRWNCLCENYQVRQLGFAIGLESCGKTWEATARFAELGPPFPSRHDFPLSSLFDSIGIENWQPIFGEAVSAVEKIDTVLVTERLNEARTLLACQYGIDFPSFEKLNSRDYRRFEDLPARYQKRISQLNEADLEIWHLAERRFEADLASVS